MNVNANAPANVPMLARLGLADVSFVAPPPS
jgi:hypothetical protein